MTILCDIMVNIFANVGRSNISYKQALVIPEVMYLCNTVLNNVSLPLVQVSVYSTTEVSWLVRVVVVIER